MTLLTEKTALRAERDALAARLAECEANLAQAIADLLAERAAKTIIGQSYESERTAREAAESAIDRVRGCQRYDARVGEASFAANGYECVKLTKAAEGTYFLAADILRAVGEGEG